MTDLWDQLDPGFFVPIWLLVGLLAVVAIALLEIGAHRRREQALRLFAAPHLLNALTGSVSTARRILKRLLLVGGVACVFIALARPHLFFRWQEEVRHGIDILVAVDCSKSMLTQDVKPSRLERAKLAISDFADRVPDDRLGLIDFAGDAFLQVPLTLDHDAFQSAVRDLDTDSIPRPGTDIAAAIDEAVLAFKSQTENVKILILVTDGEDLEGRVLNAAQEAAKTGLKIYTVGVGTPQGDLIPETDDSGNTMYLHDSDGNIVKSRLDEKTLKQIADDTGGAYAPLGQQGQGLDEIYQSYIATLPKHAVESRRQKIEYEQYEWPLGLGILLLIGSLLIGERASRPGDDTPLPPPARRRSRQTAAEVRQGGTGTSSATPAQAAAAMMAILLTLASLPARAAATDQAERDYKAAQYPQAEESYQDAAAKHPKRDDIKFDIGDAAYKAGEYSQAEDAFRSALETPDLGLQEKAYYNIGNAQYRQGEGVQKDDQKKTIKLWEDSLKSYESAMKLHTSADAKHNYDFVKQKLEQMKQQQQQQQQQDNQQKDQQQNQQNKSSSSSNGKGGQGQQQQNQQNQGSQQNPNQQQQQKNGQNQPQPSNGQQPDQAQNGQQPSQQQTTNNQPKQGHSVSRSEDQVDPGTKSRQDAEALLDSLKDDEKHITARSLQGDDQSPPPPPSGKDW